MNCSDYSSSSLASDWIQSMGKQIRDQEANKSTRVVSGYSFTWPEIGSVLLHGWRSQLPSHASLGNQVMVPSLPLEVSFAVMAPHCFSPGGLHQVFSFYPACAFTNISSINFLQWCIWQCQSVSCCESDKSNELPICSHLFLAGLKMSTQEHGT